MRILIRSVMFLSLALIVGCASDKRGSVSGKVTVAGKGPLPGGNIRFISVSDPNRVGTGQIKADGTYEIPDAPVGSCKVVIDNTHLDPSGRKASMPGMSGPGGGMPMGMKGAPSGPAAAGSPKPKDSEKKMGAPPSGVETTAEMSHTDTAGQKFVKIDASYSKAETTPLTFDVQSGANTKDFDVK